jgi:ankyrin repeat protein
MTRFTVEPLPPRPSLEHQQKLAKRLLRNVWAGDPDAIERVRTFFPGALNVDVLKLHDAQLVIARGYGFESWAALKRKIESLTHTPLEQFDLAVREGDAERARELLEKHADIRARINEPRFDFDSPAIHQAKKHLPLVDVLLAHGADINARSKFWAGGFGILEWDLTPEQATPLISRGARITPWAAAGLGLYDDLEAMIRSHPDCVHERGGDGKTPLHCAATCAIAKLLLDSGADPNVRDVDHNSTALQYLVADEAIARLLVGRGAELDILSAARLGEKSWIEQFLRDHPVSAQSGAIWGSFTAPGGHIYGWTLGADLTPTAVARKFGHAEIAELILAALPPKARFIEALWSGDAERVRRELECNPSVMQDLQPQEHSLLPLAAWEHRTESVRLMLEMGFNPHAMGPHRSTTLDRASFHGYADIVAMLLARDPDPPLSQPNEFNSIPLHTCIYGSLNGWKTGHPRDHVRTLTLLLEAGSPVDPTRLPSGNDELDTVIRAWLKNGRGESAQ